MNENFDFEFKRFLDFYDFHIKFFFFDSQLVTELLQIDEMRTLYEQNMKMLLEWIQIKTEALQRPLSKVFKTLQQEITLFKKFRNVEKPLKYSNIVYYLAYLFYFLEIQCTCHQTFTAI